MELRKQFPRLGINVAIRLPIARLQQLLKLRKRSRSVNRNRVAQRGSQGVMVWR